MFVPATGAAADKAPLIELAQRCHFRTIDGSLLNQTRALGALTALALPGADAVHGRDRLDVIHELVVALQSLDQQVMALPFARLLTLQADNNAEYWTDLAISRVKLGRVRQALDAMQHALGNAPEDRFKLMLLGDIEARLDNAEAARAAYTRAFDKASDSIGKTYCAARAVSTLATRRSGRCRTAVGQPCRRAR